MLSPKHQFRKRLLVGLFAVALLPCTAALSVKAQTQTQIRYLSGTGKDDAVLWDFFCTSGRKSGVWTKAPVPQFGRPH